MFKLWRNRKKNLPVQIVCPNPTVEITAFCKFTDTAFLSNADFYTVPGGKGINVARILASLGGRSHVYACLGGVFGSFIKSALDNDRIVVTSLDLPINTRTSIVIYDEAESKPRVIRTNGARLEAEYENLFLEISTSNLFSGSLICLSGSLPAGFSDSFYGNICKSAMQTNARTIVDVSGAALLNALQCGVFLTKINIDEAECTFGMKLATEIDLKEALDELVERGSKNAILTRGRVGWVANIEGQYFRCDISPNDRGYDIGAGDAMMAGLMYGLSMEMEWKMLLAYATKVAESSTYRKSAGEVSKEALKNTFNSSIEQW